MKKIITYIISIVLVFLFVFPTTIAYAEDYSFYYDDIRTPLLYDDRDTNALSEEEEYLLSARLRNFSEEYDMDLVIMTIPIVDESEPLVNEYLINQNLNTDAIVVLFEVKSDVVYISTKGNVASIIIPEAIQEARDRFYDNISIGLFAAFNGFIGRIEGYMNLYKETKDEIIPINPSSMVIDNAELLTNDEERLLQNKLTEMETKYNMDFVILTTLHTDGKSVVAFADDYYDYNGFGADGMMFMISMEERDYYTTTTGKAIKIFKDRTLDSIHNKIVPSLSNRDFYSAFDEYLDLVSEVIDAKNSGKPITLVTQSKKDIFVKEFFCGIAVIIIAFVLCSVQKKKLDTAVKKTEAREYLVHDSVVLKGSSDRYIRSHVSKTPRNTNSSSGGGSGSHRSSSGRSHGGRGGKF